MASEKSKRRKNRRAAQAETKEAPAETAKAAKGGGVDDEVLLRTKEQLRYERCYEPKPSPMASVSVVAVAIGAFLVGAGTYAQWFRAEGAGPMPQAPYLLAGGAVVLLAVALLGQRQAKPIRVGDAGVALEKEPTDIERIEWRDVTRVVLTKDALTLQSVVSSISIPLDVHRPAAAHAIAELRTRLPKRAQALEDAPSLGKPDDAKSKVVILEPPQVAGAPCKASERPIIFEKDARICARCGEIYHKDSVPERCLTCEVRLQR
jgi:hypothetical protein